MHWKDYGKALRYPKVNSILAEIGYWHPIVESVKNLDAYIDAWRDGKPIAKRGALWGGHDQVDRRLDEIRSEFGIARVALRVWAAGRVSLRLREGYQNSAGGSRSPPCEVRGYNESCKSWCLDRHRSPPR